MGEQKETRIFINTLEYGMCKEDICRIRTRYCVEWYTRKAIQYKYLFRFLSVFNILLPQISAIAVLWCQCSIVSTIMTALVSVFTALLALLNVKDKWTSYRSAAEYIKRQYSLYCIKEPPFQGDDAHGIYLSMLEQYMTEEHSHWKEMQKKEYSEEKK